MALPTTGLTLHCMADVTTHLFTTYSSSGTHSGTPVDGNAVQVWDDEGDGISDVAVIYHATNTEPNFRSSTPLMKNSCLDFDGSADWMEVYNQTGLATKALSTLIANNAFTLAAVFYPETISSTAANVYDNDALFADQGGYWGLFFKDESGTKKLYGYNFDGSVDQIGATINTGHTWIAIFRHDSGNLKLTTIDDSGSETNATDVASGNTQLVSFAVNLGKSGTASAYYNGRIGEFAFYNVSVTGSDLTDLKNYFKDKWLTLAGANPFNSGNISTPAFFKSGLSLLPTTAVNLLENTLTPSIQKPLVQFGFSNPLPNIKAHILVDISSRLQNDGIPPFFETNWPNPIPRKLKEQDWIKFKQLDDAVASPIIPVDQPNPLLKGLPNKGFTREKPQYYVEAQANIQNIEWPNPLLKGVQNKGIKQDRPQYYVDLTPNNQYSWPNPVLKNKFNGDWIEFKQLETITDNPFLPISYPNPLLKGLPNRGSNQNRPQYYVDTPTEFSTDWPNPIPLKRQTNTWINDLLQTTLLPPVTAAPFAGGTNITLNRLPQLIINISSTITVNPSDYPSSQIYWRTPELKKRPALSWLQSKPTYYQDIKPFFQNNWLNPFNNSKKAYAPSFLATIKPPEPVFLNPFIPVLFSNPQVKKRINQDWNQSTKSILQAVATIGSEFTTLPTYRAKSISGGMIGYATLDSGVIGNPFIPQITQLPIYDVARLLVDIRTVPGNAPEVIKPFNQNNWLNPRHKRMNPLWLNYVVMDQNEPFIGQFTTPPLPRRRGPVFSWIQVPLVTAPFFTPPAGKQTTIVPNRKGQQTLSHIVESLALDIINLDPIKPINLPNPRSIKFTPIWLWGKPFYYVETFPNAQNLSWPNPVLGQKLNKDWIFNQQIQETTPVRTYNLAPPVLRTRQTETWIIDLLQSTLNPGPGGVPFYQTDYPNPLGGKRWILVEYGSIPSSFSSNVPFNQNDWPVFRIRNSNHVGYVSFNKLESNPTSAFPSSIFDNPLIKKQLALTWLQNILETTISPAPPISETDWPNPIYGKRNPTGWIENKPRFYTGEIPFKFIEFPVALKKILGLTHTDNPVLVLTAIPGNTPFHQNEWPLFLKVKRINPDIINRGGLILGNLRGRVICLLSDATEYNLESAIDALDFEARFEIYDLESGGDECQ